MLFLCDILRKVMKKLSIFMLFVLLATACVDNDYDLRNVDADNITIGDET